jgi:ABC-type phosphate transport system permease subunit
MDTTTVLAAVYGCLIGALLVQIARRQDHQDVRLMRLSGVMTILATLTVLVTSDGGHSQMSKNLVFAIEMTLLAIAAVLLILAQRIATRRRAGTPPG